MLDYIFAIIVIFFGIGDVVTTYIALGLGLQEGNPTASYLIDISFWLFIIVKSIAMLFIYCTYKSIDFWVSQGVPVFFVSTLIYTMMVVLSIIGILLCINNTLEIIKVI